MPEPDRIENLASARARLAFDLRLKTKGRSHLRQRLAGRAGMFDLSEEAILSLADSGMVRLSAEGDRFLYRRYLGFYNVDVVCRTEGGVLLNITCKLDLEDCSLTIVSAWRPRREHLNGVFAASVDASETDYAPADHSTILGDFLNGTGFEQFSNGGSGVEGGV